MVTKFGKKVLICLTQITFISNFKKPHPTFREFGNLAFRIK